jgi:molecular chaperone HtpG
VDGRPTKNEGGTQLNTQDETFEFQVEAQQLLQLMIHSIYSNKDIFLRELVSNASDALDKLRLETLRDHELRAAVDTSDLHVEIEADKEQRTLTVRDNGIGMSRDEVVQLIGMIAKSGTSEFVKNLKEAKDAKDEAASQELIGQFGVGFYSAFMVADTVTLVTRRAGESEGTRWQSGGAGTYTIGTAENAPQGTSVTLHLKPTDTEDSLFDYTSESKLREIIKRYSDFITWPIKMAVQSKAKTRSADADGNADGDTDGDAAEADGDSGADEDVAVLETVNSMKALWARSQSEVTDEEYGEFYKHISHDWSDPLETVRIQAEGTFEYQALLFIPARAPLDLFMQERKRGVQLYVKRVFIMDDCEALMPEYLRFVKGVVDAQDLSLNVSRETLQQDRQIRMMRRRLVKKVLSTVKDMMSKHPERYETFWEEFGKALKEGLLSDFENRDAILEVSSFASTHDPEKRTSLREYVERMKEGQQHIYYLTGDSRSVIENSPHMEALRDKGYEVLLLTDQVDEVWVESAPEFEGKQFQSIAKGQVDLDTDEDKEEVKAERERREQEFSELLSWMTTALQENVKEVRLSSRLTTSPACIVTDTGDLPPALENMYRAMGQPVPTAKRILELNPTHPLVSGMRESHDAGGNEDRLGETAELLYGMALLADGGEPVDRARFVGLLAGRLERTL